MYVGVVILVKMSERPTDGKGGHLTYQMVLSSVKRKDGRKNYVHKKMKDVE